MAKKRKAAKKETAETPEKKNGTTTRDEKKVDQSTVGAKAADPPASAELVERWQTLKKEMEIYRVELNDTIARTEALQQDINEAERKQKTALEDIHSLKEQVAKTQKSVSARLEAILNERLPAVADGQEKLEERVAAIEGRLERLEMAISDSGAVRESRLAAETVAETEVAAPSPAAKAEKASAPAEEAEAPAAPQEETPPEKEPVPHPALEVKLTQNGRSAGTGRPLMAEQPLQAELQFVLQQQLTEKLLEMHPGFYQVSIRVARATSGETLLQWSDSGELRKGLRHYTHVMSIPSLPEGSYHLHFQVVSALGVIDQKATLQVEVEKAEPLASAYSRLARPAVN